MQRSKARRGGGDGDLAVYVPAENHADLFDSDEMSEGDEDLAKPKLSKRWSPTKLASRTRTATPPPVSDATGSMPSADADSSKLKRTKSLQFFAGRSLSFTSKASKPPKRVADDSERRSLNHKAANVLGLDLEGRVVTPTGKQRFSLHRRSLSANVF